VWRILLSLLSPSPLPNREEEESTSETTNGTSLLASPLSVYTHTYIFRLIHILHNHVIKASLGGDWGEEGFKGVLPKT
jgi:hypothetical protein